MLKEWTNNHSNNYWTNNVTWGERRFEKTPEASRHKMVQYLAVGDDTNGSGRSRFFPHGFFKFRQRTLSRLFSPCNDNTELFPSSPVFWFLLLKKQKLTRYNKDAALLSCNVYIRFLSGVLWLWNVFRNCQTFPTGNIIVKTDHRLLVFWAETEPIGVNWTAQMVRPAFWCGANNVGTWEDGNQNWKHTWLMGVRVSS